MVMADGGHLEFQDVCYTNNILILHSMDCLTLTTYGYNFKSRLYHTYKLIY